MAFALTRYVIGERLRVSLTDGQADEIHVAMRGLLGVLSIEEKFSILTDNFEEFEGALLNGALYRSLYRPRDWAEAIGELHTLNRRLVNLLATTRLFADQVPHTLSGLFPSDDSLKISFTRAQAREYDAHLGYRVMEAVRNYIQHRSLPVHVISYNVRSLDTGSPSDLEHVISAQLNPAELRGDGKFKASVLAELEALGDKVQIAPFVHTYVACIARIHNDLRAALAPSIEDWDRVINKAVDDYRAAGGDPLGLVLADLGPEPTYKVVIFVSADPAERRKLLERRNHGLQHFERAVVANRPPS